MGYSPYRPQPSDQEEFGTNGLMDAFYGGHTKALNFQREREEQALQQRYQELYEQSMREQQQPMGMQPKTSGYGDSQDHLAAKDHLTGESMSKQQFSNHSGQNKVNNGNQQGGVPSNIQAQMAAIERRQRQLRGQPEPVNAAQQAFDKSEGENRAKIAESIRSSSKLAYENESHLAKSRKAIANPEFRKLMEDSIYAKGKSANRITGWTPASIALGITGTKKERDLVNEATVGFNRNLEQSIESWKGGRITNDQMDFLRSLKMDVHNDDWETLEKKLVDFSTFNEALIEKNKIEYALIRQGADPFDAAEYADSIVNVNDIEEKFRTQIRGEKPKNGTSKEQKSSVKETIAKNNDDDTPKDDAENDKFKGKFEDPFDMLQKRIFQKIINTPAAVANTATNIGDWLNKGNPGVVKGTQMPYYRNPTLNQNPETTLGKTASGAGDIIGSIPGTAALNPYVGAASQLGAGAIGNSAGAIGNATGLPRLGAAAATMAGPYATQVAGNVAGGLGRIAGNILHGGFQGGVMGGTLAEENKADNAVNGMLVGALISGGASALAESSTAVRSMFNRRAPILTRGIQTELDQTRNMFRQQYDTTIQAGEAAGANNFLRPINIPANIRNNGGVYLDSLREYNNNPTLANLHRAQSDIGKMANYYYHRHHSGQSVLSDQVNQRAAIAFQNQLQTRIMDAFTRSGATQSGQQYAALRPRYATEYVQRFMENDAINKRFNLDRSVKRGHHMTDKQFIDKLLSQDNGPLNANNSATNPGVDNFANQVPELVNAKGIEDIKDMIPFYKSIRKLF